MRTSRASLALAGLAVGALALTACGSDADATGGGSDGGNGGTLGFSSPVMAQAGQQAIVDGATTAGGDAGIELQTYDANLSIDTQVSNIQTMVDRGVDAIAAWALDDGAIAGAYAQAAAADIPVIGINSAGDGVLGTIWWESQTCDDGGVIAQLAQVYADAKPGGDIAIIGGPEVPSIAALTECFTSAAEAAGLNVVTTQNNVTDASAGANQLVADILQQNPDLDGIWSYNDNSALGASSAVLAAGGSIYSADNPDGVVVTGINGDQAAIDAINDGSITATVDPDTVCTGYVVIAATEDALDDGELSRDYVVASQIVDSSNVADWVAPADKTCSLDDLPLVD